MADITIHHSRVEQAVEDMRQATRQMHDALDNLKTGMSAMAGSFSGQSADAWREFQAAANAADGNMQSAFGQGSVVLTEMHEIQRNADHRGASLYG